MEGGILYQVFEPCTKKTNGRLVDGNKIQDQNKYRINLKGWKKQGNCYHDLICVCLAQRWIMMS